MYTFTFTFTDSKDKRAFLKGALIKRETPCFILAIEEFFREYPDANISNVSLVHV